MSERGADPPVGIERHHYFGRVTLGPPPRGRMPGDHPATFRRRSMPTLPLAVLAIFAGLAPLAAGRSTDARPARRPVASDPPTVRAAVPLPGGTAALAATLGCPEAFDRATALLDAARLLHESPPGEGAAADLARARLAAYRAELERRDRPWPPPIAGGAETVPLPLTPRLWSTVVLRRPVRDDELAFAILGDRRAAFVYTGLFGLDRETLAALAADERTLARLAERHAAVFAAFGRSVRVRDGRVVTPGSDSDRWLWEALVGAPTAPPGPFILALFEHAGGRLAFFYDTVAHLDAPAQRYALAAALPPERRLATVQALARVFATAHPSWVVADRPFARPPLDAALVLRLVRTDREGRLVGPTWPELLARVFDDLPAAQPGEPSGAWLPALPAGPLVGGDPSERADAAWLLERLVAPLPPVGRARLDALLFGQRVFPAPDPADAPALMLAMRGRIVFPALVATIERLGVRDVALYAAAVRRAASLMQVANPEVASVALAQFQGALALVDRMTRRHVLTSTAAADLLGRLLAFEPDPSAGYGGQLVQWFDELADRLARAAGQARDGAPPAATGAAEELIVRALAGAFPHPGRPRVFADWDGERYEVDYGAAELARLRAIRQAQGGHDLDAVLAFARVAAGIQAARPSGADLAARLAVLEAALARLDAPVLAARHAGRPGADAARAARRALETIRDGPEGARSEAVRTLVGYADALVADVVTALAYAPALGSPDGPALAAGRVALRHDFGLLAGRQAAWDPAPGWALPVEDQAGGWHLRGALLALDVALARLSLRYLSADTLPPPPRVNANDWRTFAETAAFLDPSDLDEATADRLADAIARGRARLDALLHDPARVDALAAAARLSEVRREALRWRLAHDRAAVPASLSLLELVWLGGESLPPQWGTAARAATGCLCLEAPEPAPWEHYAGRPATGLLATRMADLTLQVMLGLRARGLPPALLPGVLAFATPDFLHAARLRHPDDGAAFARAARDLPDGRFVDYLSALAAGGPIVAASGGAPMELRR
jgi:hypothetical protein